MTFAWWQTGGEMGDCGPAPERPRHPSGGGVSSRAQSVAVGKQVGFWSCGWPHGLLLRARPQDTLSCGRALDLLMITMRSTSPDSSSSRRKSAKVISCVGVGWALEIGLGVELGLRRFSIGGHLGVAACALRELV